MKLPSASVLMAAKTERLLRAIGLGRSNWVRNITETAKQRWIASHDLSQPLTEIEMNGVRLKAPSHLVPHYLDQRFDPLSTSMVRGCLRKGMTAVDVGAHVGYYALLASKCVGPEGRVFAVEPAEENIRLLRENIVLVQAGNIKVFDCAAGDREAIREFRITESSFTHGFYHHPLQDTFRVERIRQLPLDAMVKGRVDFVKIDVEGAEIEVLRGMSRILSENRNLRLIVEWNPACLVRAGADPADLPAFLEKLGFRLTVLDDTGGYSGKRITDLIQMTRKSELPASWFVNLWAEHAG